MGGSSAFGFPRAAALAVCLLITAPARADPEPVRLSWVRGPGAHGCAGPAQIAAQVAARLGKSPFEPDAARSIDVYVTRGDAGWRAEIYVRGRDGKLSGARELTSEAPDCGPIEAASVLAVALAIDPEAGTRPPPPPSPSPPPPSPPPAPRREPPDRWSAVSVPAPLPAWVPPPPPPESPPAWTPGAGAALRAGVGIGLLPHPAAALSLAAEASVARAVHVTGEALWMPEVRASDARFAFGLSAFSLGVCGSVLGSGRADLAVCGALWGGALHGVVYSLSPVDPGQHPWAGVEAAARLRIAIASHLRAEIGLPLIVPVVRQPFTVTGFAAPVFQEAPVTVLPSVGLGATFP